MDEPQKKKRPPRPSRTKRGLDKLTPFSGYTQKCKVCNKDKSANEFKHWTPQGRIMKSTTCADCRQGMADTITDVNRRAARTALQSKLAGALRKDKIDVPHISELAGEFIKQYGGLEQYVLEMKADIDEVRTTNPGNPRILQAMNLLNKLILASTQLRDTAPDMVEMSDEEVDEEINRLLDVKFGIHQPVDEDEEEAKDGPGLDTGVA